MKLFLFSALCLLPWSLFSQLNIELQSKLTYPNRLSDVWGYEKDGREYALIGELTGLSIVDVSDPKLPVKLFFVPGDSSIWRDIKTYNDHAYVTNEKGGGLLIVDLKNLPSSIVFNHWTGDTVNLLRAHNLWIDDLGIAYIFGSNHRNGGAIIADLNQDPFSPNTIGLYNDRYVHDGVVFNDLFYSAEIQHGQFSLIDVSNKKDPVVLARQGTPLGTTHNCWPSVDGNTLFTTSEKENAFIVAYDVSNPSNITELDRYQSNPGDSVVPHNTHVLDNYLINSYYVDGITIVDATEPDNLVETGNFDTSPADSGTAGGGAWGAYPYLSSGNILATDIFNGFFILKPTYARASYLTGQVLDSLAGTPVVGVNVSVLSTDQSGVTDLFGRFKLGTATDGVYTILIEKENCTPKIVTGINLDSAQTKDIIIEYNCQPPPTNVVFEEKEDLKVFPNPTSGIIQFSGLDQNVYASLNIFDVNGASVFYTTSINDMQNLDLNFLADGLYSMVIMQAGSKYILPLFKE